MIGTRKTYFPGLHALRFFAATFVIFHHLEQYKSWAGHANVWGANVIDALGHQPVSFFFVLSGFLITYLLLVENEKTGQINIGKFYWRRILRIWPLYFVIVALALFVVPLFGSFAFENFRNPLHATTAIVCLLLFLPNLLRLGFPNLLGANQLWSVGIEEQFYLFWPLLVKRFIKNIIPFLILFIVIKSMIHLGLVIASREYENVRLLQIIQLYKLFPVEQMAIGGLGAAFLFHEKVKWVRLMTTPLAGVFALTISILIGVMGWHHFLMSYLQGIMFCILIFQVIHHKVIYQILEKPWLTHLGNISYSIYMWHALIIAINLSIVELVGLEMDVLGNVILYISTVGMTLGISHLSFVYLEKPFLKLKEISPKTLLLKINLRKESFS
ncbi:acyltransferase family protein [Ekhidna sp.]|uniref:acyltransferase family protein n=1 Tax=Ekhidna sp. TaxID=2608089 RepID=UPI003CCBB719